MVPSSPRPPAVSLGFEYPLGSHPRGWAKKPGRGSPRRPARSPPRRPTRPSGPSPETRASARPSLAGPGVSPRSRGSGGKTLFPDAPERARMRPSTSSLAAVAAAAAAAGDRTCRPGRIAGRVQKCPDRSSRTPRRVDSSRAATGTPSPTKPRAPLQPTKRHRRGLHLLELLDDPAHPRRDGDDGVVPPAHVANSLAHGIRESCANTRRFRLPPARRPSPDSARRAASGRPVLFGGDVRGHRQQSLHGPGLPAPERRRRPPAAAAAAAARSQRLPRAYRALDVAAEDPIHQRGVPRRSRTRSLARATTGADADRRVPTPARRRRRRRRRRSRRSRRSRRPTGSVPVLCARRSAVR